MQPSDAGVVLWTRSLTFFVAQEPHSTPHGRLQLLARESECVRDLRGRRAQFDPSCNRGRSHKKCGKKVFAHCGASSFEDSCINIDLLSRAKNAASPENQCHCRDHIIANRWIRTQTCTQSHSYTPPCSVIPTSRNTAWGPREFAHTHTITRIGLDATARIVRIIVVATLACKPVRSLSKIVFDVFCHRNPISCNIQQTHLINLQYVCINPLHGSAGNHSTGAIFQISVGCIGCFTYVCWCYRPQNDNGVVCSRMTRKVLF